MKRLTLLLATCCMISASFTQDTVGIKINRLYMENAENRNWSLYLSPPLFAGNTLRYLLGKELSGKALDIPPNIFSFDIGIHKFIWNYFSLGFQYQHSNAKVTRAALIDKTTSAYTFTDLNVSSDNVMLTGRYYYTIVLKNRWDREKYPKSAERLRRGSRKIVMFSGIGVGYGKVKFNPSNTGTYDYPELKRLNDVVVGIELFGVQYYFNKHLGSFITLGSLRTGIYTSGHIGVFINP